MKIELIITIDYDNAQNPTYENAQKALDYAAMHLASKGFLSDEDESLLVETWSHKVILKAEKS